jgi:hypothetical protein
MCVHKMTVDVMFANEMTENKMTINEMSVYKMTVAKMSINLTMTSSRSPKPGTNVVKLFTSVIYKFL